MFILVIFCEEYSIRTRPTPIYDILLPIYLRVSGPSALRHTPHKQSKPTLEMFNFPVKKMFSAHLPVKCAKNLV